MKTITVRELRHAFPKVIRWVENGEAVEVTKHGKVVAVLNPPAPAKPRKVQWPDIAARTKAYCGDFVLSDEDMKRIKDYEERSYL